MEANDKREEPAQEPKEAGESSVDPRQLAGSLLRTLNGIPWLGFGAIGTAVGVALLYAYFRSIDFMPSDIASILAASVFVALLALGFYLVVVLALIGPVWAFREFGLPVVSVPDRPASPLESWGLPALQVLGVGLFLLFVGARSWLRCEAIAPWLLLAGTVLALVGAITWAAAERAIAGRRVAWWRRLAPAFGVCFFGTLPFVVLVGLLPTVDSAGWWNVALVLLMWLMVVCATRWERIPVWGYALG